MVIRFIKGCSRKLQGISFRVKYFLKIKLLITDGLSPGYFLKSISVLLVEWP